MNLSREFPKSPKINKGWDEDKYAVYGGTESRQDGETLPVTTPQNGPLSRKVKVGVVANSFATSLDD